jgi:hypothetical protein
MADANAKNEAYDSYMDVSNRFAAWLDKVEANDGIQASTVSAKALIGAAIINLYSNFGPDFIRETLNDAIKSVDTAVHASNGVGISTEVH